MTTNRPGEPKYGAVVSADVSPLPNPVSPPGTPTTAGSALVQKANEMRARAERALTTSDTVFRIAYVTEAEQVLARDVLALLLELDAANDRAERIGDVVDTAIGWACGHEEWGFLAILHMTQRMAYELDGPCECDRCVSTFAELELEGDRG